MIVTYHNPSCNQYNDDSNDILGNSDSSDSNDNHYIIIVIVPPVFDIGSMMLGLRLLVVLKGPLSYAILDVTTVTMGI